MITRNADSASPGQFEADAVAAGQQRWYPRVLRFAVLFLGDETKALRCAEQILVNLQEPTIRRSDSECTVRVFRTALSVAQGFLAANQSCRRKEGSEDSATQNASDSAEPEGSAAVCWALAQLPGDERLVIVLRHFEQIAFDEIARIARLPSRTVKSQCRDGLLRLNAVLESTGILRKKNPLAFAASTDTVDELPSVSRAVDRLSESRHVSVD